MRSPRGVPPSGHLPLGRLGKTFQLAGALRFRPVSEAAFEALEALEAVYVTGAGRLRVRDLSQSGDEVLVFLEGVRDRNAAQELVNAELYADPAELPGALLAELQAEDPEERLRGLEVRVDGVRVGSIRSAHFGLNDYVEIDLDAGGQVLAPLNAPYARLSEAALEFSDPPAGLFER